MDFGEKLKQARLEAGLSQRQLCGDVITRNMLSQIESGKARPSMATLQYLAGKLGKPVGYFLEEDIVLSPNIALMEQARNAYGNKHYAHVLQLLQDYQQPDALFDQEYGYLMALAALELAAMAMERGDAAQAVPLLEQLHRGSIYYREDMERRRKNLLLRGYEFLEQYCKTMQDFEKAYFYACKARAMNGR
jgi:transcriptional regulator with XRE-family HTH domain